MIKTVENFLIENKIENKTVLVGFSTGPDSCALALVLDSLKEKYNLKLILCYYNHNWRKEAIFEEEFTKKFAAKINARFLIEKAPEDAKKTEDCARNLRYDFFYRISKKTKTDTVFLAHNKNDNVETLIYRLIKGTSIKGLCSIPKKRDIFYRPLLDIDKKEILEFLSKKNQEFKVDTSNENIEYKRNYIRKKILPLFLDINKNYLNNINNLIETSINSRKIIDNVVTTIKKDIFSDNKIILDKFLSLDKELRFEILIDFLDDKLKQKDYKTIKKLDNFIINNKNSRISLNKNQFLRIKDNKIFIETIFKKNPLEIRIDKTGEYFFEDIKLKIEKIEKIKEEDIFFPPAKKNICYLNLSFPLTLRHRKNGDIFSPYGLKGTMKLKDYLINEKIEQEQKDKLVLLCKNNEICWILGEKISENYKVTNSSCYKLTSEGI